MCYISTFVFVPGIGLLNSPSSETIIHSRTSTVLLLTLLLLLMLLLLLFFQFHQYHQYHTYCGIHVIHAKVWRFTQTSYQGFSAGTSLSHLTGPGHIDKNSTKRQQQNQQIPGPICPFWPGDAVGCRQEQVAVNCREEQGAQLTKPSYSHLDININSPLESKPTVSHAPATADIGRRLRRGNPRKSWIITA